MKGYPPTPRAALAESPGFYGGGGLGHPATHWCRQNSIACPSTAWWVGCRRKQNSTTFFFNSPQRSNPHERFALRRMLAPLAARSISFRQTNCVALRQRWWLFLMFDRLLFSPVLRSHTATRTMPAMRLTLCVLFALWPTEVVVLTGCLGRWCWCGDIPTWCMATP